MADFVQTMKDWRRMCKAQDSIEKTDPCRVCPLANNANDCCGIYEDNEGDDTRDYSHIEGVITRWAAEHPETEYPTWIDWLADQGLIFVTSNTYAFNFLKATDTIPADIAKKLGIEPKEG